MAVCCAHDNDDNNNNSRTNMKKINRKKKTFSSFAGREAGVCIYFNKRD